MSTHYEAPSEVRELEQLLNSFAYSNGYDVAAVFDDWLRYIIGYFTWNIKPLESWCYKKEHSVVFWKMLYEWTMITKKQVYLHGWYDAFGDLYMAIIGSTSRTKRLGQNFTPNEICELMSSITGGNTNGSDGNGMILDPTCGSGRTLLSAHIKHPRKYIVAEDIDRTCCMMTACNFIIHACQGEVIWHDSLDPESYYGGWFVNEHLGKCGLPSVREIPKEESRLWNHWQERKLELTIKEALDLEKRNTQVNNNKDQ